MKLSCASLVLVVAFSRCGILLGQPGGPADPPTPPAANENTSPMLLEWVPQALQQLSAQATAKSSFTLDRSLIAAAAGLSGGMDADTKQAIGKLDGVSVHVLHFNDASLADPVLVGEIRDAYHIPGWKHVVATNDNVTIHDALTDVWVVMDGINVRGAVVMVQGVRSLTLATVAGNLSPLDLLHLRGHFGIPRFDGDRLNERQ